MKRLLLGVLLLILFPLQSLALIECDCNADWCTCFIQLGDDGTPIKAIREFLVQQEYLDSARGGAFDRSVYEAVSRFQEETGLKQTGMLDDETLTRLIHGQSPEDMDALNKEGGSMVYVPTDGGKKRHANPRCSGMHDPRKVSVRNAEAMEMDACKRCSPS
ncbi:MAG: peptidoglycan-binding protein [Clostridia bacterium]|nr:peptidoglycan-binding protein [Clostridia bacterium]